MQRATEGGTHGLAGDRPDERAGSKIDDVADRWLNSSMTLELKSEAASDDAELPPSFAAAMGLRWTVLVARHATAKKLLFCAGKCASVRGISSGRSTRA